jgi:phage repressor protein C with HTH and peptisase S24 domain
MFSWEEHLYIKRLQWLGDGKFSMISDNALHPARTIRAEETYIQARVLLVWNANLV